MIEMTEKTTVSAKSSELPAISQLEALLNQSDACPSLNGMDGEKFLLPPSICEVLQKAVHLMSTGVPIALIPEEHHLSTQEAANILNVSRPHLYKILDSGKLGFSQVGTHRRIRFNDLMTYKEEMQQSCNEGLSKLAQLSQAAGYEA